MGLAGVIWQGHGEVWVWGDAVVLCGQQLAGGGAVSGGWVIDTCTRKLFGGGVAACEGIQHTQRYALCV